MIRKCCLSLLGIVIVFSSCLQNLCLAGDNPTQLGVSAQSAILIDASSKRVLFEKNASQPRLIASLTKIMTAIVAIEKGKMSEFVRVGPNAVGVEGSSIYLKLGEKIPLETLLYGLMLRSGNDAATAIAEHIGGSVEGFVYLMNEKAEHLGLQNTHFTNPHGLDHPKHYSSAKDLAYLTAYGMKYPVFKKIVSTKIKDVSWPGEDWQRKFYNKNKLLRLYPYADGVKTGYTKKAHRTLVSSATKGDTQLIAVTLDDGNDWQDSMNMFDYGFKHYRNMSLVDSGKVVARLKNSENKLVDVITASSFPYAVTSNEKVKVNLEPVISYPVKMMRREKLDVGLARVYFNNKLVGTIPLETQFSNEESIYSQFKKVFSYVLGQGEAL